MYGAWETASGRLIGVPFVNALESGAPAWLWRYGGSWQPVLTARGAVHDPNPPITLLDIPYVNLSGQGTGAAQTGPARLSGTYVMRGLATGQAQTSTRLTFARLMMRGQANGGASLQPVVLANTPRQVIVTVDDTPAQYTPLALVYALGQVIELRTTITDLDGNPLDPPIVRLVVKDPSGGEATYTYKESSAIWRDGTGRYRAAVELQAPGYWYYRWEASSDERFGAGMSGVVEAVIEVLRSQVVA